MTTSEALARLRLALGDDTDELLDALAAEVAERVCRRLLSGLEADADPGVPE
jgi:hypothetical protein